MGVDEIPWTNTVFEQPWWLEAAAPGAWGEVRVERDGVVQGRLPYVLRRRLGLRSLTQAPLTRFLGPWVGHGEGKYAQRSGREKDVMTELIAGLPSFDAFAASFAPEVTNHLPFHWAGFDARVRYTYRIDGLDDIDAVWGELSKDMRKVVRRAERTLRVRDDLPLDHALAIQGKVFAKQGLPRPFDTGLAQRLDRACEVRGARTSLVVVDADERVHAAAYCVHDRGTTYLLYSGLDPDLAAPGAYPLVRWRAIRRAAERGRRFDFLGSMLEPIERMNRHFGARQVPYLFVSRDRPRARVARAAQTAAGRVTSAARKRRTGASRPPGDG